MEAIVNTFRNLAEAYNNAQVEYRMESLYGEVMGFAESHARMGHDGARFDVFWDNNQETRKVCRRIWEEGILTGITSCDDDEGDIMDSVLKNECPKEHCLEPNSGIASLYLSWR